MDVKFSGRRLLIFAWEYYGYHSKQGAALSRRITQVAEAFKSNGWEVVVIHRDHLDEGKGQPFYIQNEQNGIKRIEVKLSKNIAPGKNPVFRMAETMFYLTFRGDRTYRWAQDVITHYDELKIEKPSLIISFYTPRGPLYLGNYFSKKLGIPWIADLQDELTEGISPSMYGNCRFWARKTLASAAAVVQVSGEWAEAEQKFLGRKVAVIRHAVPDVPTADVIAKPRIDTPFTVFYGGSIDFNNQSLTVLRELLSRSSSFLKPVKITFAGNEATYDRFKKSLGEAAPVEYLGWLDDKKYREAITRCDCCLVLPWSTLPRQVIPSKFYELCAFNKPVWIVGNDTGAFDHLMTEWGHPRVTTGDVEMQLKALNKAISGDTGLMFNLANCEGAILRTGDIYGRYMALL